MKIYKFKQIIESSKKLLFSRFKAYLFKNNVIWPTLNRPIITFIFCSIAKLLLLLVESQFTYQKTFAYCPFTSYFSLTKHTAMK